MVVQTSAAPRGVVRRLPLNCHSRRAAGVFSPFSEITDYKLQTTELLRQALLDRTQGGYVRGAL